MGNSYMIGTKSLLWAGSDSIKKKIIIIALGILDNQLLRSRAFRTWKECLIFKLGITITLPSSSSSIPELQDRRRKDNSRR